MPHKCVRCGKVYGNLAPELMKGCGCSSRIFLFMREDQVSVKEKMDLLERESRSLIDSEQVQELAELTPISIEKFEPAPVKGKPRIVEIRGGPVPVDELESAESPKPKKELDLVQELAGGGVSKVKLLAEEGEEPIENVTVLEKGTYRLNIESLMAGNPLVIRTEKGVFYIRIPSPVEQQKQKNKG